MITITLKWSGFNLSTFVALHDFFKTHLSEFVSITMNKDIVELTTCDFQYLKEIHDILIMHEPIDLEKE